MFDKFLNTPVCGMGSIHLYCSYSNIVIVHTEVFRTLPNVYVGAFLQRQLTAKSFSKRQFFSRSEDPSQMF